MQRLCIINMSQRILWRFAIGSSGGKIRFFNEHNYFSFLSMVILKIECCYHWKCNVCSFIITSIKWHRKLAKAQRAVNGSYSKAAPSWMWRRPLSIYKWFAYTNTCLVDNRCLDIEMVLCILTLNFFLWYVLL